MEGNNLDINAGKDKAYKSQDESHKQGAFCSVGGNRVQAQRKTKELFDRPSPGLRLRVPLAESGYLMCQ